MQLTIGKLAESAGVGVETVRFYQRKGLLDAPAGGVGIRRYGAEEVRRLRFIRSAQRAGFTLEEIRGLLALDAGHDHVQARQMALARVAKLDQQISELQRARESLQKLARRCADSSAGPCPILGSFED